ncbi:hypothetical protein [Streptomyces sp. NPDC059814]
MSRQVLLSLARVLRLSPARTRHLCAPAGQVSPPEAPDWAG